MSSLHEESKSLAVVIDNGTGSLKAGFTSESQRPKVILPTLIGTPKNQGQLAALDLKDRYIGEEAQAKRGLLSLLYPIERGVITDWDAMEEMWQAVFGQLKARPTEQPVLMTDAPLNPTTNRKLMTEIMFEKFGTQKFYAMTQGVLSFFASGRGEGIMVDCGEGATHVVPIEGLNIRPHAIQRTNMAGGELTKYLHRVMMERGYNIKDSAAHEVVREVKESLCYVAADYDKELTRAKDASSVEGTHILPDGRPITLSDQRFRVPEALFQPSLMGADLEGIHEMVYKSIMKCDIDARSGFFRNIILCGGSTLLPGFGARLKKEISSLAPSNRTVTVVEPPDRKFSVYRGGCMVASLSFFQNMWITKQQYEEHGATIVHQKCS